MRRDGRTKVLKEALIEYETDKLTRLSALQGGIAREGEDRERERERESKSDEAPETGEKQA